MIEPDIIDNYRTASKKLVLLDYDGTLVNFAPSPDKAVPTPPMLAALHDLIHAPGVRLMVITGRGHEDIEAMLGHLPIDIIAGHGAMARENGKWEARAKDPGTWKMDILALMNQMVTRYPGSYIEEKQFSLGWHYRNVESGYTGSRELIKELTGIAASHRLKILDGNAIVETMEAGINKGKALKNTIVPSDYDCILCIGDDKTDEDMFEFLSIYPYAITIKVGPADTIAKYRVNSVEDVISLLKQLGTNQA